MSVLAVSYIYRPKRDDVMSHRRRLARLQREFMPMPCHQDGAASAGGYAQVAMPGDHR
jgi:hypothetical protein